MSDYTREGTKLYKGEGETREYYGHCETVDDAERALKELNGETTEVVSAESNVVNTRDELLAKLAELDKVSEK